MNNLVFSAVAGPQADGGAYVGAQVFSSPGGKLCRFEVASQTLGWCLDGEGLKLRAHPNVLYVWSPIQGTT